ncbi:LacI family DNA-binding transcriptional regulator [Sphingobacterium bovistauri]|uniref:LacI family DNA-binding transcriptional regulator n=1 Tax=Sphingobacterium bovistauri TaxID=2781959 RepID=A0ABS7Z9F5_9SPHI|nr:LacI family DNA-binding transcriptional regulator [Sphingobacterium bovistauri]MCA5006192.1 LacI family DNA-binding transcriptional regulator [Sphingobacterium bovistauri]
MNKAGKPTTIKEIARKLRISPSTVSRALNDHPSIGLVTTMRVKKLAEELNYEPNQTAIFFKQRKTFTIGVILPKLSEPFFASAISAIEEIAAEKKFTVLLGQSLDNPERELNIINSFRTHRVDGILMSLGKNTIDMGFVERLHKYEIPIVFFDCVPENIDVPKVYCDLSTGIHEAVKAFVERGHKQIALINGPETLNATGERTFSFKNALLDNGLTFDEKYVVYSELTEESNYKAMEKLRALDATPSAILAFNDYVTFDIIKYAKENGISLGRDIQVISFANYSLWKYMDNPPLASIEQYPAEQGAKAAEILFEMLENKDLEISIPDQILASKLVYQ